MRDSLRPEREREVSAISLRREEAICWHLNLGNRVVEDYKRVCVTHSVKTIMSRRLSKKALLAAAILVALMLCPEESMAQQSRKNETRKDKGKMKYEGALFSSSPISFCKNYSILR